MRSCRYGRRMGRGPPAPPVPHSSSTLCERRQTTSEHRGLSTLWCGH
eukprot:gene5971-2682_t